jgi:hypothetical protein
MTIEEIIAALRHSVVHYQQEEQNMVAPNKPMKSQYFRIGNIAIKIAEIKEILPPDAPKW